MAMSKIYLTLAKHLVIRMPTLSKKYPSSRAVFHKWRGLECFTERIDISEASTDDLERVFAAPKANLVAVRTKDLPIHLSLTPIAIHLPYLQILHRFLPVPCEEVGKRLSLSELRQLENRIPDEIYAEMLGARLRDT
jgi:hypothetical protein